MRHGTTALSISARWHSELESNIRAPRIFPIPLCLTRAIGTSGHTGNAPTNLAIGFGLVSLRSQESRLEAASGSALELQTNAVSVMSLCTHRRIAPASLLERRAGRDRQAGACRITDDGRIHERSPMGVAAECRCADRTSARSRLTRHLYPAVLASRHVGCPMHPRNHLSTIVDLNRLPSENRVPHAWAGQFVQ